MLGLYDILADNLGCPDVSGDETMIFTPQHFISDTRHLTPVILSEATAKRII